MTVSIVSTATARLCICIIVLILVVITATALMARPLTGPSARLDRAGSRGEEGRGSRWLLLQQLTGGRASRNWIGQDDRFHHRSVVYYESMRWIPHKSRAAVATEGFAAVTSLSA